MFEFQVTTEDWGNNVIEVTVWLTLNIPPATPQKLIYEAGYIGPSGVRVMTEQLQKDLLERFAQTVVTLLGD